MTNGVIIQPLQIAALPSTAFKAGNTTVGSAIIVPDGLAYFTTSVPRAGFPNGGPQCIDCKLEISYDGGMTWTLLHGFTACGGDAFDRNGVLGIRSVVGSGITRAPGTPVLVRARVFSSLDFTASVNLLISPNTAIFQPPEIPHSVAFDAVGPDANGKVFATVSSVTYTHPGTSSDDGVGISVSFWNNNGTVSSLTYGGTATVQAVTKQNATTTDRADIWGLKDLVGAGKQGSQTVVANFSNALQGYGWIGSVSATGTDTTTLFDNINSAIGSSTTPSVTCSVGVGGLILDCMNYDGTGFTGITSGTTPRWTAGSVAGTGVAGASSTATSGASSYTLVATRQWAMAAASFKAASGAVVQERSLTMTGAGA